MHVIGLQVGYDLTLTLLEAPCTTSSVSPIHRLRERLIHFVIRYAHMLILRRSLYASQASLCLI